MLTSENDQRNYRNAMTQMYEFRLGIDPTKIHRADKYVLAVTYQTPSGERLSDEMIIGRQSATESR